MGMAMTFFSATNTALYSLDWQPATVGAYAGTCIFLIILAVVFRGLIAMRSWREEAWRDVAFNRRYVTVAGKLPKSERLSHESSSKSMTISENGIEENVMVVKKKGQTRMPWRFSIDPVRAAMDTVIVGVGYLIMLAVMTMNTGYFLSIIGGTFLGSLAFGRFASDSHL
ncbi:Ctr copper transporter [Calycina marina]|uniref:Copper transport protein n=1 Tax=Calycina marina TaxID=1763456 RepID=A0A9P7Z969_9HELO|nr:Ctr copper transporter [Calycina marina]